MRKTQLFKKYTTTVRIDCFAWRRGVHAAWCRYIIAFIDFLHRLLMRDDLLKRLSVQNIPSSRALFKAWKLISSFSFSR